MFVFFFRLGDFLRWKFVLFVFLFLIFGKVFGIQIEFNECLLDDLVNKVREDEDKEKFIVFEENIYFLK